jgi:hypothetical protein
LYVPANELLCVGLEHVVDFVQEIVDFIGQFADAVLDVSRLLDRDLVDFFGLAGGLLLPTTGVLRRHDQPLLVEASTLSPPYDIPGHVSSSVWSFVHRLGIGQAGAVSVEEVAEELYALPPEEFTAARAAAAKADKAAAKDINALRKPTVGAWLVNTLARSEPVLLDELLALGPALGDAQRSGQGDALRELGERRRQLIGAVTDKAFGVAGRAATPALRSEVGSTLEAALADPATADAVRSGRLTRTLSYAGFGGVDLDGAVAVGPARAASRQRPGQTQSPQAGKATKRAPAAPKPDRSKDIAAAEARAQDAAGELDDAVRAGQQAQQDQDHAERAEQQAAADVTSAEAAMRAARDARTEAERAARKARHRTEQAAKAVQDAQTKAEKARHSLDKLRRG